MGKCISLMYFSMHMWETDLVARRKFIQRTINLLASGKVRPPRGMFLPLSEAAEAHRMLEAGKHTGRIFLQP